jgi:hypothetical protein
MSPTSTEHPTHSGELRGALARIVTSGPDEAASQPELQALIDLPAVRQRVEAEGESATADAIVDVLAEAVEGVSTPAYRRLLTIVLGLGAPYRRLSPLERRTVAGKEFRGGTRPVKPNTVRQFHEPRALDELAAIIADGTRPKPQGRGSLLTAPGQQNGYWAFGTPDGNAAGLEDALSAFVSFDGRRFRDGLGMAADDRSVRVIVGSKGSGKTLYIRRLQAAAQREQSIYADRWRPSAPSTAEIISLADWGTSDSQTVERWERTWHRATLSTVVSHILAARDRSLEAAQAQLDDAFKYGAPEVLSDTRAPRSIYDEVSRIIRSHHRGPSLDTFLNHPQWGAVEDALSQSMGSCPPMCFYLDALDERFEVAPHQWLLCQLGLFRFVMSSRSFQHFGSRLHVVITLRDIVFSAALESEHSSRYMHNPSVRRLNWDTDAIEYFLNRKIERLAPEYLSGPPEAPPIEHWLGLTTITSRARDHVERIEDYLLRHTRLLPRDIIVLGNDLCSQLDTRLDEGQSGLSESDVREVVHRAARRSGQEQLRVVANHVAATLTPRGTERGGDLNTYVNSDGRPAVDPQRELTTQLADLLKVLRTDRFGASALENFDAEARECLPEMHDLASILWQHRLVGYITDDVKRGDVVFYGSVEDSGLVLPRDVAGYALHPILLETISSIQGCGEPVIPR